MIQHSRIAWIFVMVGTLLLLPSRAAAQARHGKLRVTSFPAGAYVWIDGKETGKVTPMSMDISVGFHKVVVSIPNSGWNADVRNVDVVAGNNDLSVILLPILPAGPMGPPGPKGDPGPAGSAGPQGPAGPSGPKGATGATGATGPAGPAGAIGPVGPQGAQGLKGDTGATGAVGATGATGPAGPAGAIGPVGPQGAQGLKGDTGATGATGPAGPVGPIGPQGQTGNTGPMGATGGAGPAGPVGPAGPTGPTGPTGSQGPAGPPGAGLNGRQEFQAAGTFVVPTGVSRLSVELYGAGGGGALVPCNGGGGGGGGAYTNTILPVQEGQILTIMVGAIGRAGTTAVPAGGNGGDTQVLDANNTLLAFAQGGGAGQPYPPPGVTCGTNVPGAAGGAPDLNAAISHSGPSAPSVFSPNNNGAVGYLVPGFPFQQNGQFGGGGAGAFFPQNVQAGQGGYAQLSW